MNGYTVYKLTSPSGKIYIGITMQGVEKRWENGRGYRQCPAMWEAIKKYGWKNFSHEILHEGLTKEEAEAIEIELIRQYRSTDRRFGYNIDNGGNASGTHSEETRRKISEGNRGKKNTEEAIQRMREAHKGQGIGESNPFFGRHHSEETRQKHSEFMRGNQYNKGNHHTEEFKRLKSQQMHDAYSDGKNPRCKAVVRRNEFGDVIERFCSLTQASKRAGVSKSAMYNWINNEEMKEWDYEERT